MAADCVAVLRLLEPIVTARVLVIGAHPDDETIGAGGLLARCIDAHVVVVTDGAPRDRSLWPAERPPARREEYAATRRRELSSALALAGISDDRIHVLDVVDCEATEAIPAITDRLVTLLNHIRPDIVVTHAYEGGHVDHDATALAVRLAMDQAGLGHPHEMALYHGAHSDIAVHEFVPGDTPIYRIALDSRLRARKAEMLAAYASQQKYAAYFGADLEQYRCAPAYDFRKAPYAEGPLLYERNAGGMSGEQWRHVTRDFARDVATTRDHASSNAPSPATASALVSVVVRTIGRATLDDALESIVRQTHNRLEIVVVSAGENDPSTGALTRDGLIVRKVSARGFDRPKAANAGLAAATGDYVIFLDDDDWFHSEHVASLVAAIGAAKDARVAYSGVEVVEWPTDGNPRRRWVFASSYDPVSLLVENYIPLNGVLFERSLIEEGARFDERLPLYEDWDFLIDLSRRTRFHQARGVTAVYRWPPGSGVNDPRKTAEAQEQVFLKWRDRCSPAEYVAVMRRAIQETELNSQRASQQRTLQAHLHAQDDELAKLRAEREQLLADQASLRAQQQSLQAHLQAQDNELAKLRAEREQQLADQAALRAHLVRQDEELERLRPERERLQEALETLRRQSVAISEELASMQLQQQRLVEENQIAVNDRQTTRDRLAVLEAEQAALLESRSWRITAPLRAAERWVRRQK